MNSVTRWKDIIALNWWINVRSRLGWASSMVISAVIAADVIAPRLELEEMSAAKAAALFFLLFVALMTAIWLIGLAVMLLMASANLVRKGAIGPKSFTISDDAFTENDGLRTTAVSWRQIRSIDKTRGHIFVRISRWKYIILSARDFRSEYEFAQYYADLVKAKHENT